MTDPVAAAHWFIDQGFTVFAIWGADASGCFCPKGKRCDQKWGKHPANANGFLGAHDNKVVIEKSLRHPKTPNFGIRPKEGVIIIDKDGDLSDWPADCPTTLTVVTPNGEHIYLEWEPVEVPTKLFGKIVRSHENGYVVGPGSATQDGEYVRKAGTSAIAPAPLGWALHTGGPATSAGGAAASHKPLITVHEDTAPYVLPTKIDEDERYPSTIPYSAHLYNLHGGDMSLDGPAFAQFMDEFVPLFTVPWSLPRTPEGEWKRATKDIAKRLGPPVRPAAVEDTTPVDGKSLIVSSRQYAAAYDAEFPDGIPWIAEGYVYVGGVTLLSGPPKGGKSTLLAGLQKARFFDGDFLGKSVAQGPTLLATEETGVAVLYKVRRIPDLSVLDFAAAANLSFPQLLQVVADWANEQDEAGLVFLDTWSVFAGLKDENDASEVTRRVAELKQLTALSRCAVCLVHHTRKGSGEHGEAIRGSGALLATVDISLELNYASKTGDERYLDSQGRVVFPDRKLLEFNRADSTYTVVDEAAGAAAAVASDVADIPDVKSKAMTVKDLAALWGETVQTARLHAKRLRNSNALAGEEVPGARGSTQWVFWRVPLVEMPLNPVDREDDDD